MSAGKVRVVVYGTTGKAVQIDPKATEGAIVGRNLRLPDGTVVTLDMLRAAAAPTPSAAATLWRLIREVPGNIAAAAAADPAGIVLDTRAVGTGVGLAGGGALDGDLELTLQHLGLEDLEDPGATRLVWWNPSTEALEWLELGTGLSIDAGVISAPPAVDFDLILTDDDGAVLVDDDGNVLTAE